MLRWILFRLQWSFNKMRAECLSFSTQEALQVAFYKAVISGDIEEVKRFFPRQQSYTSGESGFRMQGIVIDHKLGGNVDINCRYNYGETVMHFAAIQGNLAVAEYLVSKGAEPDIKSNGGQTPLWYACEKRHFEMVKFFLMHGAFVDPVDDRKNTPLIIASKNGDIAIVRLLLENGANIWATNAQGGIARDKAIDNNHTEILELLDNDYGQKHAENTILEDAIDCDNSAVCDMNF